MADISDWVQFLVHNGKYLKGRAREEEGKTVSECFCTERIDGARADG